jgi:hypothetical protein
MDSQQNCPRVTVPLQIENQQKNDLTSRTVGSSSVDELQPEANLAGVISAHALLRIASGTSGILIGLYLASLCSDLSGRILQRRISGSVTRSRMLGIIDRRKKQHHRTNV